MLMPPALRHTPATAYRIGGWWRLRTYMVIVVILHATNVYQTMRLNIFHLTVIFKKNTELSLSTIIYTNTFSQHTINTSEATLPRQLIPIASTHLAPIPQAGWQQEGMAHCPHQLGTCLLIAITNNGSLAHHPWCGSVVCRHAGGVHWSTAPTTKVPKDISRR